MAIPFPSIGFIPNPPYPTPAFVSPGRLYSPAWAFRQTPPPTNIFFNDQVSNQNHVATVSSNDGKTLTISTEGGTKTFPISGDGSANIPVGILLSP